jgi:hypothetical protein
MQALANKFDENHSVGDDGDSGGGDYDESRSRFSNKPSDLPLVPNDAKCMYVSVITTTLQCELEKRMACKSDGMSGGYLLFLLSKIYKYPFASNSVSMGFWNLSVDAGPLSTTTTLRSESKMRIW